MWDKNIKKTKKLKDSNTPALLGLILSFLGLPGLILSIFGLIKSNNYINSRKKISIIGIIVSSLLLVTSVIFFFLNFVRVIDFSLIVKPVALEWCSEKKINCVTSKEYSDFIKAGNFVYQSIKKGKIVKKGTRIDLIYSKGKKTVKIIDFSTMTKTDVENWCFDYDVICYFDSDYSDSVPENNFLSQSVEPGTEMIRDDTIKIVYSLGHKKTDAEIESEFKSECSEIDYRDALRSPSDYSEKKVHWYGKVTQVANGDYYKGYMINVNCEENRFATGGILCNDPLYVVYLGNLNLIEDDIVDMWGTMATDSYTYTTVLGTSNTIPLFSAKYISIH